MTNPRKPFRLNVGFIIKAAVGFNRDFDFYFPRYVDDDLVLTEVEGLINVGRTSQGLIVQGNFSGHTTLECVRCLTTFEQPLKWEFTEVYAFKIDDVAEFGLIVPEDGQLDLQTIFREYAILEIPIQPICREDCQGLCIECGQNLNEKDCGHSQTPDSPFATLENLLED